MNIYKLPDLSSFSRVHFVIFITVPLSRRLLEIYVYCFNVANEFGTVSLLPGTWAGYND